MDGSVEAKPQGSRFTNEAVEDIFSYHAPQSGQPEQYGRIRDAAKAFCRVLVDNTPASADQTVAVRKIREAVMVANASIALGGKY